MSFGHEVVKEAVHAWQFSDFRTHDRSALQANRETGMRCITWAVHAHETTSPSTKLPFAPAIEHLSDNKLVVSRRQYQACRRLCTAVQKLCFVARLPLPRCLRTVMSRLLSTGNAVL